MFYFSYPEVRLGKQACKGTSILVPEIRWEVAYTTDFVLAYALDYFLKYVCRCVYKSNSKEFKAIRKL